MPDTTPAAADAPDAASKDQPQAAPAPAPAPAKGQASQPAPAPTPAPAKPAAPAPAPAPAPEPAPEPDPPADPEPSPVPAEIWALSDHRRQVLLAGLLVDSPDLRDQKLTPDEWQTALDKYEQSERI